MTCEELKLEIRRLGGELPHRDEEPGVVLESGGCSDGQGRVLVIPSWTRGAMTPARTRRLLNQVKFKLKDHLVCTLLYDKGRKTFLLSVENLAA